MASYFTLTLDTTAPSGGSISVPARSNTLSVTATLSATGATYMKLYIVGPDLATISKVSGYNVSSFSFSANEAFNEWSVRVVPSTSSTHDAGTEIPSTNGSTNMHGTTSTAASTAVNCTINGADLETASSGDGAKIIKVFVKDLAGNWSS